MESDIRVLVWGLGAMGSGMARMIQEKDGVQLVGAVDINPAKVGRDAGEVVGLHESVGVTVACDGREALAQCCPDLVVIATRSFVREVMDEILLAVEYGANVISIAEEMADPWAQHPKMADAIDKSARERGVTVLGTGINPGFVLDLLIVCLSGVCVDVESVVARRVNDLSPFGPTVMETQGVGTTLEQFQAGIESGSIVGHVGFPESISLIARALGLRLDRIEQTKEPIISNVARKTEHVTVEPGWVAGCRHIAVGYCNDKEIIRFEHPQQILPELEGVDTGDYITIEGTPRIDMAIKPEIPGGLGTTALAVNMIPLVHAATAGLRTMVDFPVPRALRKESDGVARAQDV